MNILIVEDELLIAQTIQGYLAEHGHTTQAICISYQEALAAYQKQIPDLVLLDIRLYGEPSGIAFGEFLSQQPEKIPFIYLTSQQDVHAVKKALRTTPYGYLPKPIHKSTLWTTVEAAHTLAHSQSEDVSLTIFDGSKYHSIKASSIIYVNAEHVYAKVCLRNGKQLLTRKPLGWFTEQTHVFIQTHRSFLVNPKAVQSWNNNILTLDDGTEIPVSRYRKKEVQEKLQLINL